MKYKVRGILYLVKLNILNVSISKILIYSTINIIQKEGVKTNLLVIHCNFLIKQNT